MNWLRACESTACPEFAAEANGIVLLRDGALGDASPVLHFTVDEVDELVARWPVLRGGLAGGEGSGGG